jgi:stage II sporulation protein GA (sporulation sigma-E factor processing peptidase)
MMFFISQFIIGGCVYFGYSLLDRFLLKYLDPSGGGVENRGALYFSVIILFALGVTKLLITVLSDTSKEKSALVKLMLGVRRCEFEALIDTGNLVKDPLSMTPVMFVKKSAAARLIPKNVLELENIDALDKDFRKRIRLIPVTRGGETHVLTGFRVDSVTVTVEGKQAEVEMTLAIDKEEGSFGGYEALIPGLQI